mgnify:CR=1 FL=1
MWEREHPQLCLKNEGFFYRFSIHLQNADGEFRILEPAIILDRRILKERPWSQLLHKLSTTNGALLQDVGFADGDNFIIVGLQAPPVLTRAVCVDLHLWHI